ncbi:hypothetical protein CC85DRAFT_282745 [Cutaneotrichosporon oleaginosum]|uniref:Secreted protein n=1 Tax=Cutaneotrichosporon oleaginosum TaxID=879819 RepID=A0A0J0XW15_9TREE|nr:uncharacterized protein CC85DRAFT_282745 [Cutaneotrichosporon oleaginosum]KLT45261.1 hypothetical protein CC85DRAFT_282745 [Cutaneotrichosporon oleaginosum]TXT14909.1 hypothetical protein COLE_01102 [Cutaneotrichosporon oleaginosum]
MPSSALACLLRFSHVHALGRSTGPFHPAAAVALNRLQQQSLWGVVWAAGSHTDTHPHPYTVHSLEPVAGTRFRRVPAVPRPESQLCAATVTMPSRHAAVCVP